MVLVPPRRSGKMADPSAGQTAASDGVESTKRKREEESELSTNETAGSVRESDLDAKKRKIVERRDEEEPTSEDESHSKGKNRRPRTIYLYGNYRNYYQYRNETTLGDPRVDHFSEEHFAGKDVLDIGCNSGILTMNIVRQFHPKSMKGVDIDAQLIQEAKSLVHQYSTEYWRDVRSMAAVRLNRQITPEQKSMINETIGSDVDIDALPISCAVSYGPLLCLDRETEEAEWNKVVEDQMSNVTKPSSVYFLRQNYVANDHVEEESLDTVLCLSVTKWIHLNFGDDGIRTLFDKVYRSLRPGGYFILEPQPWRSYRKKRLLTEDIHKVYRTIELRPAQFEEYLTGTCGFVKESTIEAAESKLQGFNREVIVFRKPEKV